MLRRIPMIGLVAIAMTTLALAACGHGSQGPQKGDVSGDSAAQDGVPAEAVPQVGCSVSQDCPANLPQCNQATSSCVACKKNDHCHSSDRPYCNPASMTCVECVMANHCPTTYEHCLDGKCSDKACFPGKAKCVGNSIHFCSSDGMDPSDQVIKCGNKKCHKGDCLECVPSEVGCKGSQVIECDPDGKDYDVLEICSGQKDCFGGACMVCYPGSKRCEGNKALVCNVEGTGWEDKEDCSLGGLTCYLGACLSPCAGDLKQNTNAGCEFFAVDLDNYQSDDNDAFNAQFAVIVSNTSSTDLAEVTVTHPDGKEEKASVPAQSLHKFELPPTFGVNNTVKGMMAFRVNSSRPITVYQFNPLSNVAQVFSNDASVLLPAPGLGNEYYVMTYGFGGTKEFNEPTPSSYFTIVGSSSVTTQVTFTVTAKTIAGEGLPSLSAGQTESVELELGEVLSVNSAEPGGDLSGTHITANAPIGVFGGHECPYTADRCCCDHIEQQLVPVSTWGTQYLLSKSWERWKEKDYVRIMASKDGTKVTVIPAVAGNVPVLNAGEYFTFQTSVNLEVNADKPILVAQFLSSSYEILGEPFKDPCWSNADCPSPYTCDDWSGTCAGPECINQASCPSGHTCETYDDGWQSVSVCEAIGDPAMILAVSAEQYQESYVFLTPDAYLEDYLNIIAPLDANQVVLDNNQVNPNGFVPIGTSGYGAYRVMVSDGVHTVWSDKKIGIVVYGYDNDVSYGYPGGMGLVDLQF